MQTHAVVCRILVVVTLNKSGVFLKDTALSAVRNRKWFSDWRYYGLLPKIDSIDDAKAIVGCIFLQSVRRFVF